VKFFLPEIYNFAVYKDRTKFQGSHDKSTWVDLFTMQEGTKEGWNYHSFEDPKPSYRYYRFAGDAQGGCNINEISFTGVETVDNNDSTYTCAAKLVKDQVDTSLNDVTYDGSLTPVVTSVNPRFGGVEGGETITFTGSNLDTDTSKYSIVLDGINCPVQSATST
jgi:hypothetical protein